MVEISSNDKGIGGFRRLFPKWIAVGAVIALILLSKQFFEDTTKPNEVNPRNTVTVVLAPVEQQAVAIQIKVKGTVLPKQTIVIRPQLSAVIKSIHIKEGQFVTQGDKLFTFDTRDREANLAKSNAQLSKTKAELAIALRNYQRQQALFRKNFISQAMLDAARNQVELLQNQLKFDQANIQADRVSLSHGEIYAPISGRTGSITLFPGSLVQPEVSQLVSIMQLDPIQVSFALPESELGLLQQLPGANQINAIIQFGATDEQRLEGRIVFIDNAIDTASGTIHVKAEFANEDQKLWPGMFVEVILIKQWIPNAIIVPVQAVQAGPTGHYVFVIDTAAKAIMQPVSVLYMQEGFAVIDGLNPGYCVVVEGAHTLRPGTPISENSIILRSDKTCERLDLTRASGAGSVIAHKILGN